MRFFYYIKKVISTLKCSNRWKGSAYYWEKRYLSGGTSGAGSYNNLAQFKAKILNGFVQTKGITSVIEWGCGDGNQLSLSDYPCYIGYDVSKQAIKICKKRFCHDTSKVFVWSGDKSFKNENKADLSLSLDVIYHLVEDEVYEQYMRNLFLSARRYVIIYACDSEEYATAIHVKSRKFTSWIKQNCPSWNLIDIIKNDYPYNSKSPNTTSWSDFYIFEHI